MALVTASELSFSHADIDIFSGVSLEINQGDRIGMVGPNGGGKTSLIKVLVGEEIAGHGQIYTSNDLKIGYVPQIMTSEIQGTIRDYLMHSFQNILQIESDIESSATAMAALSGSERSSVEDRYASLISEYESLGGSDYLNKLDKVTGGLGLDSSILGNLASMASGGERTRASLARALLSEPDLLVLDEPTNYLDFKGLAWLEMFLLKLPKPFLVVSHDRFFLDSTANRIWELENGTLKSFRGNYSAYRVQKSELVTRQYKEYHKQQEQIEKDKIFIARYKAGQRSREAKGREKKLLRMNLIDAPTESSEVMKIKTKDVSRSPQVVMRTSDLKVGYSDESGSLELISVKDLKLNRGSRTCVIGGNGSGKTTLLKTLLGEVNSIQGEVFIGDKVKVGYHRQGSDDLPPECTVIEVMQDLRNITILEERDYLAKFLFKGEDVFKTVSMLSGGEKTRLSIARLLATQPNFLILDEPNTHLDIWSREALENALNDFLGTMLIVSHDRHLVTFLAQQLVVVENKSADIFEGTLKDWMLGNGLIKPELKNSDNEIPVRRKFGTPRKKIKNTKQKYEKIDNEKMIYDLEARLSDVESQLQSASERQDIDAVNSLGKQYDKLSLDLERAWESWGY